jgi:hypothetical protein
MIGFSRPSLTSHAQRQNSRCVIGARPRQGAQSRRYARHLDLQNELPERVPNQALSAFVKSVGVCCGAPGR